MEPSAGEVVLKDLLPYGEEKFRKGARELAKATIYGMGAITSLATGKRGKFTASQRALTDDLLLLMLAKLYDIEEMLERDTNEG